MMNKYHKRIIWETPIEIINRQSIIEDLEEDHKYLKFLKTLKYYNSHRFQKIAIIWISQAI